MNLPGSEFRVTSWRDLIETLHSHELVRPSPGEGDHLRSPYVFRGMDVAGWAPLTSLERVPRKTGASISIIEHSLIRSFRKYANSGAFDDKSEWYILAVAQHNGLPTRCLDWTSSPLVATHFACGNHAYATEDAVIWCLHAGILREINARANPKAPTLRGVSWVYDTRLLERTYPTLEDLDATAPGASLMLLWEPPSLDARIANQSGLLSIMNGTDTSPLQFLEQHCQEFGELLVRIVIEASAKAEIRDMLDQNNMSERILFPGLPGLCEWLKRYYSKAW